MRARTMLVEDQPEIRPLMRMTREFGDFELAEAPDPDVGWTLMRQRPPAASSATSRSASKQVPTPI